MAPARQTVWVLLALSGVLNLRSCWTFTCPSICKCSFKSDTCYKDTGEKLSCTRETQLKSQAAPSFIRNLMLIYLMLSFFCYSEISQSDCTRYIRNHAFLSLHSLTEMKIIKNGFKEIKSHAFNGTKLDKLILKDNRYLRNIHEDAFEGASGPTVLDVSSTALDTLPRRGLEHLKVLIARSTPYLKTLPPLESLLELEVAEVTYPSHCCAFHTWRRKDNCPCTLSEPQKAVDHSADNVTDLYDINLQYPDLQLSLCPGPFQCTPESDAFNPCEDLLGYSFLRSVTWLITVFAVAGNMAVLVVLIISHQKLNVSRFLICNLAFADLCMGVYLLLIAATDYHSRKEYYNHATFWQTGAGCGVAGFLTVFASELSVYTLTMITLERWHTITNAMHKNKRLRLRHVVAMMAGGWGFSLLAALLPVLGVSSYTKVSICLPMDIESLASQVYVVALLLLNVTAFFIICYCYVRIYLSIHNPDLAIRHGDSKIAKRMAVLIFTDFICMAPISFFGILAALRMPLITVSHSKILLVLFYPINSLCNPFLYTIFTRSFRKDIRLLLSRCSFCHDRFPNQIKFKSNKPSLKPQTASNAGVEAQWLGKTP
uniref:Luteinizing hormone/choriogonadotropin receptor n=1 Tax=Salmo trutta TaxID=8032 RepID=A0A673Y9R6_SALTR